MVITAVITDTQMGLHQLLYRLVPVVQLARMRAAQAQAKEGTLQAYSSESFDVGPAGLDRVTTDRASYPNATDPVRALLDVYSQNGVAAQVVIALDTGLTTTQMVNLNAGYQTISLTVAGSITPGLRTLTAILLMGEYWTARSTSFDYGTSLPDLRPSAPSVAPGGHVTRTVIVMVGNEGRSTAAATTAYFYDGTPITGTLIGAAPVPALAPGEMAVVPVVWGVQGQGGEHTLYVSVEPVGEFDETDNDAWIAVTLPRLDAGLAVTPASIAAGESVTLSLWLENLQGAATLPATATVEIRSPVGAVVYSRNWGLTLNGGEVRRLEAVWQSGTDAAEGMYAVLQEVEDAYGERVLNGATFAITIRPGRALFRVYLPLVLRK